MKTICGIFISILISISAFASDRFYKPTDKITFTYEEFRKLSVHNQEQWIKELRNFNRNVDLVIDGKRLTEKKPKYWSFLEKISFKPSSAGLCLLTSAAFSSTTAEAQDKSCFLRKSMVDKTASVCVVCKVNGMEILGKCAPNDRKNPNVTAAALVEKINAKDSKDARLNISSQELTAHVKDLNEKGHAAIKTEYLAPNTDLFASSSKIKEMAEVKTTPKTSRLAAAPQAGTETKTEVTEEKKPDVSALNVGRNAYDTAKAEVTAAPAAAADEESAESKELRQELSRLSQKLTTNEDPAKIQAGIEEARKERIASGRTPIIIDPNSHRSLNDLGDRGSNDDVDADEVTKTDRLACIYAGWAVQTEGKCNPVTEKEISDGSGKKVTYSCKKGESSDKVIYGATADTTIVLCNPILFGLVDGKPICIKKAANATELCAQGAGAVEDGLALARQNPDEYRKLTKRVSTLCQSDEAKLRAHFEKRGKNKSQVDYAIKDLSVTCTHLRGRMAQIEEANITTGGPRGTR